VEREEEEAEGLMTRRWIRDEVKEDGSGGRTKADVVAMRMARRRKRGGGWRRSCGRGGGGARGAFITAALPPDRYIHRRTSLPRLAECVVCGAWRSQADPGHGRQSKADAFYLLCDVQIKTESQ